MATITISREAGSGGEEIATRVCGILGYQFFNRQLMLTVATDLGLSEEEVIDYSADAFKTRSFIDVLLRRTQPVATVTTRGRDAMGGVTVSTSVLDEEHCLRLMRSAMREVHQRGNVVIVGRGSQALLQQMLGTLHVRIVAPFELRARRVSEEEGFSEEEARRVVEERDRARAQYLSTLYGVEWDDTSLYDLVVSTRQMDLGSVAQLISNVAMRAA
jgi:cytidylate kinase